jgi:hypothetical protein
MIARAFSIAIGGSLGLAGGAAIDHYASQTFDNTFAPVVAVLGIVALLVWSVVFIGGARREMR